MSVELRPGTELAGYRIDSADGDPDRSPREVVATVALPSAVNEVAAGEGAVWTFAVRSTG